MITYKFYTTEQRLIQLQSYIRKNMPTARFEQNPFQLTDGTYSVTLNYEIEDINKIHPLMNEWYYQDNPPKQNKSLWDKFKALF